MRPLDGVIGSHYVENRQPDCIDARATVRNADTIVLLRDRTICEKRTDDEFMCLDGLHERLPTAQRHMEPAVTTSGNLDGFLFGGLSCCCFPSLLC